MATPTEIRTLTGTLLDDSVLTLCNTLAQTLFDDVLGAETCFSVAGAANIILLLAAHFLQLRDSALTAETIGNASETKRNPYALSEGLSSTYYGQNAILVDCSGKLAKLSGGQRMQLFGFGAA